MEPAAPRRSAARAGHGRAGERERGRVGENSKGRSPLPPRPHSPARRLGVLGALALALLLGAAAPARAQDARIADLTTTDHEVPIRLMGYGLVVGLDGTGDRAMGNFGSRQTVQSVANLLRNFGIEVPAEVLRTRNVAAVLVTAEASPFLRPGGRFEVQVASVGDALSLRGGVLWATPLVMEPGGDPVATAQGPLLLSEGVASRRSYTVETTARIPGGGLLGAPLPRQDFAASSRLLLRRPNLSMATRIAAAINAKFSGAARVEDPGSVALTPPAAADGVAGGGIAEFLAQIGDIRVPVETRPRIVIDGRDGTIAAGGDLPVGDAVVSYGSMTLTIGGAGQGAGAQPVPGQVRVRGGTTVQDVAAALHSMAAPATAIAAMFESLREVGAITAEVTVR